MKSTPMSKLIFLGECLNILNNPGLAGSDVYNREIGEFLKYLEDCGLDSTKAAAETLQQYELPYFERTNRFTPTVIEQLKASMATISNALVNEISVREVIVLKTGEVTGRLGQLPDKVALTPIQQHLLGETVRCIKVEAYRSAAVMGWNLVYDCVRQWVFDNKLADFNSHLQSMYGNKSAVHVYEDFFVSERPISEYEFLNVLRGPGNQPNIIRNKIIDVLVHYLRQRNDYAHPNFTAPSANKTNAYIEHLLDVICAPPFA